MKNYVLMISLLLLPLWGLAQQEVRGRVVAAHDNSPLPGASVRVMGTAQGTITDAEGDFALESVPPDAVLLVQSLGHTAREVKLPFPLSESFVITLEENAGQLGEVLVSTGYQQLPPERATGSFAQVSRERFNEQVTTDVISRLEAVANGLTVNRGTLAGGNIVVRGLSSIQGPEAPLIVVDNFPYEGDLHNINPNDVESVTVLKDAAAASIWGARAGNGVIVITTRQGRFNQPIRVEFNSNITVGDKPDLSYLPFMSNTDYIAVEEMLFDRGYYNSSINSVSKPVLSPVVELLRRRQSGAISPEEAEAHLQQWRQTDIRDEFSQHMYRRSLNQQYSLALRGGAAKHAWQLTAGYDRNEDQLSATYSRLNLGTRHTLRLTDRLELYSGLYLTQSQGGSGRLGYGDDRFQATRMYPYQRFADDEGNPLPMPRDYSHAWKETAGTGKLLDWNFYPLRFHEHDRSQTDLQDLLANTALTYRLPFGLDASVRYQYQRQQSASEHLQDEQSYAARHLVNLYTHLSPETGEPVRAIPAGGIFNLRQSLLEAHNARAQLNLDRAWGNHEVAALAGGELRQARTNSHSNRLYGYNHEVMTHALIDYVNRHPTFVNGSTAVIQPGTSLSERLNRFVSVFGNASYTYKRRYTLSASARQDASNVFGVNANDRWNPLWSTGLGWNLANEPFYKLELLPTLRLRATYGYSGNVDLSRTAFTTMVYSSPSNYIQTPTAVFENYANPNLRWEKSRMLNLGLDFGFKNDRVTGSLEFFHKKGTDLLGRALVDYTAGIGSTVVKNAASMKGRGFDLELNSRNLQAGAFSWTSHLNLSRAVDEVTEYYLSNRNGSAFVTSVPTISALVGRPVYGIYSYRWAGLDPQTGDPMGYMDGEPGKDYALLTGPSTQVTDLRFHGSALPTLFGSLGNTLSFGNFSLKARLSYKLGYYFRRQSINYNTLFASGRGHSDFAQRWQQPGDEAHSSVPSMAYPVNSRRETFYAGSEVLVERGDHVRIQYVTASYELSRAQWRHLPFGRLQAYASVNNLGLLWTANDHGIDPDYSISSHAVPPAPNYTLGLKASF